MKCDELKEIFIVEGAYTENSPSPLFGDCLGYGKEEVDEAIAELKAEIESLKASHYAEMVDAGMRERRLHRALWLARAELARTSAWVFWNRKDDYNYNKWKKVEFKCRAKAEEYK